MEGPPADGISRTLIDLPTPVKTELAEQAARAGTTLRIEIIAAMRQWLAQPDPAIRDEITARYDRRNIRHDRTD